MITVEKLTVDHMKEILKQESAEGLRPHVTEESLSILASQPHTFSCISKEDGRVLLCGGVTEYWPGRGEAWAILNKDCKREFIALHNATKRLFDICPVRRIELAADIGFEPAHRWARLLGFELEAPLLKAYTIEGRDVSLYARIKN